MLKKIIILILLVTIFIPSSAFAVDTKVKIEEGESVFLEALEESEELNMITAKIPIKFFVEYADSLSEIEFTSEIDPKIAVISSYMFIEYSDTILKLNLSGDDSIKKSLNIGPRITVEYADTVFNMPLVSAIF
jgi:major membrane immunogen (membrane-anchored lipoprotein)